MSTGPIAANGELLVQDGGVADRALPNSRGWLQILLLLLYLLGSGRADAFVLFGIGA